MTNNTINPEYPSPAKKKYRSTPANPEQNSKTAERAKRARHSKTAERACTPGENANDRDELFYTSPPSSPLKMPPPRKIIPKPSSSITTEECLASACFVYQGLLKYHSGKWKVFIEFFRQVCTNRGRGFTMADMHTDLIDLLDIYNTHTRYHPDQESAYHKWAVHVIGQPFFYMLQSHAEELLVYMTYHAALAIYVDV